jgi:hypothetical protein
MILPRNPVYVISKGRWKNCKTAKFLEKDGVPFRLVVEPQEADDYRERFGDHVEVLPFSNLGLGGIPARNWVWEHAKAAGVERHWILDDNMDRVRRVYGGQRIPCNAGPALACCESFVDRYENVAIAGLNYTMFGIASMPPFYLNARVYSCLLIRNDLPVRWRGRYNEDTDLCLQVLSAGLCTILFNAFLVDKAGTMTMKGGNTDQLYAGDGRLKMARALQRAWPYVAKTTRRFRRPQHVVRDNWRGFDTPLVLKPGVDPERLAPSEHGMELIQVADKVRAPAIRKLLKKASGRV